MSCEICGRRGDLVKVLIDNVSLNVCDSCKAYGKILESKRPEFKKEIIHKVEFVEDLVENYYKLIKSKREKLMLSQRELAMKLNEKESVISNIENGTLRPSLDLAKRLGRFLDLNLVIEDKIMTVSSKPLKQNLTVGDFLRR